MESTIAPGVLTVDLEEHFQVEAFSATVDRSQWERHASRLPENTHRLLDLFDEYGATATFFVVGWNAERHPELVREIARRGHELGCHSYWHRPVYELTPEQFADDTRRAKSAIEQAAGAAVAGYRAPSFSITRRTLWALPLLAEAGFDYDCSIFPIRHDLYGMPGGPRRPFLIQTESGPLVEFPLPTIRFAGFTLPATGGGYLRILPVWYTQAAISRLRREELPLIVYVHPWELDPGQPHIAAGFVSRLRHYTNLAGTCGRLRRVLSAGKFRSFRDSGAPLLRGIGPGATIQHGVWKS